MEYIKKLYTSSMLKFSEQRLCFGSDPEVTTIDADAVSESMGRSGVTGMIREMGDDLSGMTETVIASTLDVVKTVPVALVSGIYEGVKGGTFWTNKEEFVSFWMNIAHFSVDHPALMQGVSKYVLEGDGSINDLGKLTSPLVWVDTFSNDPGLLGDTDEIDAYTSEVKTFLKTLPLEARQEAYSQLVDTYIPKEVQSVASYTETDADGKPVKSHSNFAEVISSATNDHDPANIERVNRAMQLVLGQDIPDDKKKEGSVSRALAQASLKEYIAGDAGLSRSFEHDYKLAINLHGQEAFGAATTSPDLLRGFLGNSKLRGALDPSMGIVRDTNIDVLNTEISTHFAERSRTIGDVVSNLESHMGRTQQEIARETATIVDRWHDAHPLMKLAAIGVAMYAAMKHKGAALAIGGGFVADHFFTKGQGFKMLMKGANGAGNLLNAANDNVADRFERLTEGKGFTTSSSGEERSMSDLADRAEVMVDFLSEYERDDLEVEGTAFGLLSSVPISDIAKSFDVSGSGSASSWKLKLGRRDPAGMRLRAIAEEEGWNYGYRSLFNPEKTGGSPASSPSKKKPHDPCTVCSFMEEPKRPEDVKQRDEISEAITWVFYTLAIRDPKNRDNALIVQEALDELSSDMSPIEFFEGGGSHNPKAAKAYAELVVAGKSLALSSNVSLGTYVINYLQRYSVPQSPEVIENGDTPEGATEDVPVGADGDAPSGADADVPTGAALDLPTGALFDIPAGPSEVRPTGAAFPPKPVGAILSKPVGSTEDTPEGSVEVLPAGAVKLTTPAGAVYEYLPSGAIKEVPTGSAKTTTVLPSGAATIEKPDGSRIEFKPDGSATEVLPDGSTVEFEAGAAKKTLPDGSTVSRKPDGSIIKNSPDGTVIIVAPNGSARKDLPNGTVIEWNPDGSGKTTAPDGSVTEFPAGAGS